MLLARTEASAAACTPDANVTADCSSLVINNPNQAITIQAGATVFNPSNMAIWFKPSATHQFSAQWVYRKEAFSSSATNSLLASYSVGF